MSMKKKAGYLVPMGYWGTRNMLKEMDRMIDELRAGFNEMIPYGGPEDRVPMVDVLDEGDKYVIEAELPGVKKDEVSIEVGEDAITIEAKREEEIEEKKEGYVRRERERMSFYRRIPIPDNADSSKASAKLENGLLRITLPKVEEAEEGGRKLEVQ